MDLGEKKRNGGGVGFTLSLWLWPLNAFLSASIFILQNIFNMKDRKLVTGNENYIFIIACTDASGLLNKWKYIQH